MAKAKAKKGNVIVRYLRDTRAELRKVHWPTREETIRLTQIVLGVTVAMGLFLWGTDVLFSWWLGGILASDVVRISMAGGVLAVAAVVAVIFGRQRT